MDGDINNEVEMVIKHDPKKKSKMQYHNKMNIIASLGTFKCIIVLNEQLMNHQPTGWQQHLKSMNVSLKKSFFAFVMLINREPDFDSVIGLNYLILSKNLHK
jgi:hypothetical protein